MAEPYWTTLNWTAIVGTLGGIGTFASPYLWSWWQGREKNAENDLKLAEAAAIRFEAQQQKFLEGIIADRDYFKKRVEEMDAERIKRVDETDKDAATADAELDDARRDGRAMADWAFFNRDGWLALVHRYRDLARNFDLLAAGRIDSARAIEISNDIRMVWPTFPPPVPALRDAAQNRPPREENK